MKDSLYIAKYRLDKASDEHISPILCQLGHQLESVDVFNSSHQVDVILFSATEDTIDTFLLYQQEAIWIAIEQEFFEPRFNALLELGIHDVMTLDVASETTVMQAILRASHRRELVSRLSDHDSLTGALNAEGFAVALDMAISETAKNGHPLGVVSVDIHEFQKINEAHGYALANQLLCMVAQRLALILGGRFQVGRLGGDEFLLLVTEVTDKSAMSEVLEIVRSSMLHHFELFGTRLYLTTYIGAVLYPETLGSAEELIAQAHEAMTTGKRNKQQVYLYDRNSSPWFQMDMAAEIRRALREDEFTLHYQPRIELATGRVLGMEALLRWAHPKFGNIPPTDFIYVAENSGMILPLGNWVLARAEKDIKLLESKGLTGLNVAINLSFKQLQDPTFCEHLPSRIRSWNLTRSSLEFELTETAVLSNPQLVKKTLTEISQMGVKISLDDFGTGYSALVHVQEFPISIVKIDKSFVSRMGKDTSADEIVSSIISFAHRLQLEVVAEGIESHEQLADLQSMGCEQGQGYLFARALPLDQFTEYTAKANNVHVIGVGRSGW